MSESVVVLGASNKPERYSNKAVLMLKEYGHQVIPVHPRIKEVAGLSVLHHLEEIALPVDTLTLYVGPSGIVDLIPGIVTLKPGRVIFNPGTENDQLKRALDQAGIPWQEACTLVLLKTGQF